MERLILDAGALIACERSDVEAWRRIDQAIERGVLPSIPAGALAQAWRGPRQAKLGMLLNLCEVVDFDENTARRSGELCGATGTSDVIDASVVVAATGADRSVILTSDGDDLRLLADALPGVAEPPRVVVI